jgi:group I intron endonuclease
VNDYKVSFIQIKMCVFLFPFGEEEGNIGIIYSGVKLKSVGSIRTMSTSTRQNPVRIYPYPDKDRKIILDENKEQSGVYRWVHIESGKSYIGSSSKLDYRLRGYYRHSYLSYKKRGASLICKALLKYGYAGFRLEILEYCSSAEVLSREQFYLDSYKPEYNILKIAGSNLGYKHTEASLELMSKASKSRNQLEEVLNRKREVMLGRRLSLNQLDNMAKNNPFRQPVLISNSETGDSREFLSMTQAAQFLGIHETTVKRYLINSKPYNGYIITKVNSGSDLPSISVPTNVRQPVLLSNPTTGITKEFSTSKDACDYLEISSKRLSNYFKNIESSKDKQVNTIKGWVITKLDSLSSTS